MLSAADREYELDMTPLLEGRRAAAATTAAASPSHLSLSRMEPDGPAAAPVGCARFPLRVRCMFAIMLLQSLIILLLIALLVPAWSGHPSGAVSPVPPAAAAADLRVHTATEAESPPVSAPGLGIGPFVPRPIELVGVPVPIEPILPARSPDGSYMPYHTSITDPVLYDMYSRPPVHPLKLLHAHQALPALPSSYFGARYIKARDSFPGRFNNLRMMILTLLWFGRLLNRTVVWPNHALLQQYIDLDRLGALHPLIAERDLPAGWQNRSRLMGLKEGKDVIYPSKADYDAQPDQRAWMQSPDGGQHPSEMWVARFLHDEWGAGSGAVQHCSVLLMDMRWPNLRSLFGGFTPAMHSSLDLWTMDAFRVTPPILGLMDRALQSLQATAIGGRRTFPADGSPPSAELSASIHWRLGDYVNAHKHRHTIVSVEAAVAWTAEVMARETAAGRNTSRFAVYIATEGEPEQVVRYTRAVLSLGVQSVWLWSNVSASPVFAAVRHWKSADAALAADGTTRGIIEAMLLAQARYFLGTGRSTLTETVLRVRSTSSAHRADALQGLRRWDRLSAEPNSAGFNAAVWPPDAYEPLRAPLVCAAAPAAPALAPVPGLAATPAASVLCDPPTPTVFVPYLGSKPPPHYISDNTRTMWRHAIAPAKRT